MPSVPSLRERTYTQTQIQEWIDLYHLALIEECLDESTRRDAPFTLRKHEHNFLMDVYPILKSKSWMLSVKQADWLERIWDRMRRQNYRHGR